MDGFIVIVLLMGLVFLLIAIHDKVEFIAHRNTEERLRARVVEYRKERGSFRTHSVKLDYPFVVILSDRYQRVRKLRFASSSTKYFQIGEEIDVFFNGEDLLYWDAHERGLRRFLPETWRLWKRRKDA